MVKAKRLLLSGYSVAVVATILTLGLRFSLQPILGENAPLLVFIMPVMFSAWYGGLLPGFLATALCSIIGSYFFVYPIWYIATTDLSNTVRVIIFLLEGVFISWLSEALLSSRRRVENVALALKDREEQYRILVEGVRDYAIFGLDPNGYITSWNSGAELIKGYTAAEVLGRHFSLFYLEQEALQDKPTEILETAREEGHYEEEGWRRRKDGSVFWASVVITALRDQGGQLYGFSKIVRDITERRRSEQALRESYTLLRTVIEGTADAVFVKDRQGRYKLINSTVARILGRPKSDIISRDDQALLPLDVAIALQQTDRQVMKSGISQIVEEQLPQADETRTFLVTKDPYYDADGDIVGMIGVARDITERIQTEATQRQLLKELSDAKFALDQAAILVATNAQGIITEVNDKFCEISKFSREELIGQTHRIVKSGYHPKGFYRDLWVTITQGRVWHGEIKNRAKDGTEYWVDTTIVPYLGNSGKPSQYFAIRFDITGRKQAEDRLWRSAQRLAVVHHIDQAVLRSDSPDAIAQEALSQMRQIIGSDQSAVVLFDFSAQTACILAGEFGEATAGSVVLLGDRFPPEALHHQETQWYVRDIAQLTDRSASLESQLAAGYHSLLAVPLQVNGDLMGDLILFARLPDAFEQEDQEVAQEIANQLAIAIQQARLRQQLQQYTSELEQRVAERTAALQEANEGLQAFSYSVSHDLRAPLRAMQGLSQALLEDYGDQLDSTAQLYAQEISASAQQADQLVTDLLNYGRLSQADIITQPLSLSRILSEALAQLDSDLQTHNADVGVESPLPEVIGHRPILIQAIVNLIANAVKFVPLDQQPQIRIWAESQSGWVRLWVEDNGIGIAPEHQERIFQAFERLHTTAAYPGTGIGLAIVRKGLERMGGGAGVESSLGQGSRFWIELQEANGQP